MRYAGVIDFSKLTNPRREEAPAILGYGFHHRRAALAFRPRRSQQGPDCANSPTPVLIVKPLALNPLLPARISSIRRSRLTLNICLGKAETKNRGKLLGRNR